MFVQFDYEQDFNDLWMHLKEKYPKEIFDVDGVGKELDLCQFSKNFFRKGLSTTADASIDQNSNVDDVSVISYENELKKPFERLNSYYMIWKECKRLYGLEFANSVVTKNLIGDIYINDFHGVGGGLPYCYNYSTYDIMTKGLNMVKKIHCKPPKHLSAFKSQLEQFVTLASNSTLGACGLADLLVVMSYYVKNILTNKRDSHFNFASEKDCWEYIDDKITSLIYTLNQPMRGNQSPFTNISIYDDAFLNKMIDDYLFPDGSHPDKEIVKKLQVLFIDIMNREMERTPITFPVTTACFSVDDNHKLLDNDFVELIAKKNLKFAFINLYIGKSSTLSSCCFDGSQKVLTKSSNGVALTTFKELYESPYDKYKKNFTIFHNGSWVKGKTLKLEGRDLFKITTSNNKEILVTDNHINPTLRGDIETKDLSVNDYLLFNNMALDSFPEKDDNLTYEQGILIGAYLGDGSIYERKNNNGVTINYSLNKNKFNTLSELIKKGLSDCGDNSDVILNKEYNNVYPVSINSSILNNFIRKYVHGDYSYEKELDLSCLLQNKEFRKGILDGFYYTDGGNSNRIYTTSKKLVEQIEVLITSLGLISTIDVSDRTNEKVVIRDREYNRNYPLYCIRWYENKNKRSMKDVYIVKNNSIYFKIKSIEKIDRPKEVYCFEIQNENEQYFTLPNGIITHNCRLRSDTSNEYFNSFGSGSSKIGSLGVCTINLPRLAIKYGKDNKEGFFKELKQLVEMCARINNAKRKIVQKRIDNGNHPLYTLGFLDINTQYSTCGVNGFNECISYMGEDIKKESGTNLGLEIIDCINHVNDIMQKRFKAPHNCEQIPAEGVSVKFAKKDRIMKYQDDINLYSNQFIPLIVNADLLDRVKLQGIFDSHFSGGSILHINCDEQLHNYQDIIDIINLCAEKEVVYFAINYKLRRCVNGHMTVGSSSICSICGGEITDFYQRVVGFLTNIKNWHPVRRKEDAPYRQQYKENDIGELSK